jgi:hypothetical protein
MNSLSTANQSNLAKNLETGEPEMSQMISLIMIIIW